MRSWLRRSIPAWRESTGLRYSRCAAASDGRTISLAGKSYYIAEVEALLELVRASDDPRPHLFLLDELFRGTNAVERIAAGQAVLQQLLGPAGSDEAASRAGRDA